ncbi:hypothetical protein UT300005_29170 [Clostridium sp. CTA-5]
MYLIIFKFILNKFKYKKTSIPYNGTKVLFRGTTQIAIRFSYHMTSLYKAKYLLYIISNGLNPSKPTNLTTFG